MRVIVASTLQGFGAKNPAAKPSLDRWLSVMEASTFATMAEIQAAFPKAKVLNADRIRFEVAGGDFRMIVGFKMKNQIAFIKFLGTHAEYDRVDALAVSQF